MIRTVVIWVKCCWCFQYNYSFVSPNHIFLSNNSYMMSTDCPNLEFFYFHVYFVSTEDIVGYLPVSLFTLDLQLTIRVRNRLEMKNFMKNIWHWHCSYSTANIFMPLAWKVCRGHLVFGSSVHPSVSPSICLSFRNSDLLIKKKHYLKCGWSYSNQTWTVSSSKGCSHFTDITCPWGWGGSKCRT